MDCGAGERVFTGRNFWQVGTEGNSGSHRLQCFALWAGPALPSCSGQDVAESDSLGGGSVRVGDVAKCLLLCVCSHIWPPSAGLLDNFWGVLNRDVVSTQKKAAITPLGRASPVDFILYNPQPKPRLLEWKGNRVVLLVLFNEYLD